MMRFFLGNLLKRLSLSRRRRRGAAQRKAGSYRPELLDLESRTLLSTIAWLRPVSGDWDTAANWAGGRVPGANDDAVIPFAGISVTHAAAVADAVHSLTSEAAMDLPAGSLSVGVVPLQTQRIASRIDAPFRVDGGTLTLNSVTLGGAGTLTNFASINLIGSAVNVAVDNEAGVLASGQFTANTINNQADRPFVNGPGATLFVNSLTFANGFTNEGRIAVQGVAHHVTTLGVANGTLVNADQRLPTGQRPRVHHPDLRLRVRCLRRPGRRWPALHPKFRCDGRDLGGELTLAAPLLPLGKPGLVRWLLYRAAGLPREPFVTSSRIP